MTLKSHIRFNLIIPIFCISVSAFGNDLENDDILLRRSFSIESKKEIVTAIKSDPGPVEKQEKLFTFDWNKNASIAENKSKISEEEKFISSIKDVSKLSPEDQQALGMLFYKLGTYYIHVSREPDLAIAKLTIANTLLTNKENKAWNDNHLAYAYEQKYVRFNHPEDKEKALYYINKVISELIPNTRDKTIAFAYAVKGLIQNDAKEYPQAEKSFKSALAIYESLPDSKDDQYARTKNRLADVLLVQQGRDKEALAILKQLKQYWSSKGNLYVDPYAARNLISLGQAYIKIGNPKAALKEIKLAIDIYKNFYGEKSILLVKPYQLLAQAYKGLGNPSQASAFEQKANDINKA